jgi:hypothetical protein
MEVFQTQVPVEDDLEIAAARHQGGVLPPRMSTGHTWAACDRSFRLSVGMGVNLSGRVGISAHSRPRPNGSRPGLPMSRQRPDRGVATGAVFSRLSMLANPQLRASPSAERPRQRQPHRTRLHGMDEPVAHRGGFALLPRLPGMVDVAGPKVEQVEDVETRPCPGASEQKRPRLPSAAARSGIWSVEVQRERSAIRLTLRSRPPPLSPYLCQPLSWRRISGTSHGPSSPWSSYRPQCQPVGDQAGGDALPWLAAVELPTPL